MYSPLVHQVSSTTPPRLVGNIRLMQLLASCCVVSLCLLYSSTTTTINTTTNIVVMMIPPSSSAFSTIGDIHTTMPFSRSTTSGSLHKNDHHATLKNATTKIAIYDSARDDQNNNHSWLGWQPDTADELKCSWRECFKPLHTRNCSTCRDNVDDWGIPPPRPVTQTTKATTSTTTARKGAEEESRKNSTLWIPDVTILKQMHLKGMDSNGLLWPPPLDYELCQRMDGHGRDRSDPSANLFNAVPISAAPFQHEENDNNISPIPRLLCLIYTTEKRHATSIRAARETWAPGCDGFLVFSTVDDPRIPAISIPHDGPEDYKNMWQKVRSIWRFVGQHYIEDFDFFHLGGDDMYVLTQNLKNYLGSLKDKNSTDDKTEDGGRGNEEEQRTTSLQPMRTKNRQEEDHFVGRRFYVNGTIFNTGGPGYVLSRSVLRKFVNVGIDHPDCSPNLMTSAEDYTMAECLFKVFNITPTDTRDEQLRERFHHFSPKFHYRYKGKGRGWYRDFNSLWGLKYGNDCCAPDSVAFHYIKQPAMVRHLHKLLYGECV